MSAVTRPPRVYGLLADFGDPHRLVDREVAGQVGPTVGRLQLV